jgi:hypothetical protein
MGSDEDNRRKPGMTEGLWASNEAMTKWWRCAYTGGSRAEGYFYKLTGSPVTEKDFPVGGTLRLWELGAGDDVRLETFVGLRRSPINSDEYQLSSNVACSLTLAVKSFGPALECSTDRLKWTRLAGEATADKVTYKFSEEMLGTGTIHLRSVEEQ